MLPLAQWPAVTCLNNYMVASLDQLRALERDQEKLVTIVDFELRRENTYR